VKIDKEKEKVLRNCGIQATAPHLVQYDGALHSYLVAKIASRVLWKEYFEGQPYLGRPLPPLVDDLFRKGGHFEWERLSDLII